MTALTCRTRTGKFRDSRIAVFQGWGEGAMGSYNLMGTELRVLQDEKSFGD